VAGGTGGLEWAPLSRGGHFLEAIEYLAIGWSGWVWRFIGMVECRDKGKVLVSGSPDLEFDLTMSAFGGT
jgi:hypothetical protein